MELATLITQTWQDFAKLKSVPETADILVPESMPLLWFGNLPAYQTSSLRVLTVSKNPSDAEFGANKRFKELKDLLTAPSVNSACYQKALNAYFQEAPNPWFKQLAKFLPVFDAAYAPEKSTQSCALHVDLFTPIATTPVWPALSKTQQAQFEMIFPKLLAYLQPDIILTSLSAPNLKILLGKVGDQVEEIFNEEVPGKAAKYVRAYRVDQSVIVISGRNFQGTYFGGMTESFVKTCLQKIKALA